MNSTEWLLDSIEFQMPSMISEKQLNRHVKNTVLQANANLRVALGAIPLPSNHLATLSRMLLDCHQLSSFVIHFQASSLIRLRRNPRRKMKSHRASGASSLRTCTAEDVVEDTMRVDHNKVADTMEEDNMEEDTREVHHHHQWRTMKRSPSTECHQDHQWSNPRNSQRDTTVIMDKKDTTDVTDVTDIPLSLLALCELLSTSWLSLLSPLISTSSNASRQSKSLLRRSPERRNADGKSGRSAADGKSQPSNSSSQLSLSTLQLSSTPSTLSNPLRRSPRTRKLALSMLQLQPVSDPTRTRWSETAV